jgi:hypothetical protein
MPHYNEEGPCDYLWDNDDRDMEEYYTRQEEQYEMERDDELVPRISIEEALRMIQALKDTPNTQPKFIGGKRETD